MAANGDVLINHLHSRYPGAELKCVYESCAWGFNLQRKLTAAGMQCLVVHAADVSPSHTERKRKTDKLDDLKPASNLAAGEPKAIDVTAELNHNEKMMMLYAA